MSDKSWDMRAVLDSAWGKVIAILMVIGMLMGIAAEGVSLYRNWQEAQSAAAVAHNARLRQDAEAKIADQCAEIELETAKNAEALKRAEAEKMTNDALKSKAEQCSARIKAIIDSVPMNRIDEATEIIQRDCDPTYAARTKACAERFRKMMDTFVTDSGDKVKTNLEGYKKDCRITDEQRAAIEVKIKEIQAEAERKADRFIAQAKAKFRIGTEHEAGHYDEAYRRAVAYEAEIEADETKDKGKPGVTTAGELSDLSWAAVFARKFEEANSAAKRARELEPGLLTAEINRAHAVMFLGRTDEAKTVYLAHPGAKLGKRDWNSVVLDDFKKLRAANLTHPLMDEIETAFAPPPPAPPVPAPGPSPPPTPGPETHLPSPWPQAPFSAAPAPPAPLTFRTFDNYDINGGDIAILKDTSLAACNETCRADSRCIGYSYDKWNHACYPKSALGKFQLTARSLTAVRSDIREPAYSEGESNLERFANRAFPPASAELRSAETFEDRGDRCLEAEWCAAVTFYKARRECQMFRSTGVYAPSPGAMSAAKTQPDDTPPA